MDFLKSAGVQNMLAQIVKTAAPDLVEHIDNFAAMVKAFKDQLDRMEARQIRIEQLLTEKIHGHDTGSEGAGIGSGDTRGTHIGT